MKDFKNVNDKIFEVLTLLRKYPLMVLSKDDTYNLLQNYIEGLIDGLSFFSGINMRLEITKWYMNKLGFQTSTYWTYHIPFHFQGNTDEKLKAILLDITEEYFRENPDWHKNLNQV